MTSPFFLRASVLASLSARILSMSSFNPENAASTHDNVVLLVVLLLLKVIQSDTRQRKAHTYSS